MGIFKILAIGIVIILVGAFVLVQITLQTMMTDEDRVEAEARSELSKQRLAEKEIQELHASGESKRQEDELKRQEVLKGHNWIPIDASRLNTDDLFWDDQEYWNLTENHIERYFLNYKGKDNAGMTMQDVLLFGKSEDCGVGILLEKSNTEIWVYFVGYDNTVSRDKLTVTLNISSKNLCVNGSWWFGIDPQTGKIFAWEDSPEEKLLNILDESS